jgi:hypothetical protein
MALSLAIPLLVTLTLSACGGPSPTEVAPSAGGTFPASTVPRQPSDPPAAPGRPYDADSLLAAMRASTRPGGVPDQLETDAVAEAVSGQIWTWDGQPWQVLSAGGACGPTACTLDVAGSADGAAGADLYSFGVEPEGDQVTLLASDLHAYPTSLDARLDQAARAAAGEELGDLAYVGARWLPPPDDGRYWLAYRSGGEEGAPGVDVLLDLDSGAVLELRTV